ncbi:biotin/lipoyl attachment domain-containing protein [Denitrovibrio acetiphilus DSM 12809]|uniref:Biotin/lipoyl attachment domain-containing protein n=1 Tax=Denitrovibrio acetiphilus (strain DSM 12809 / NBRC 114555 / N2460) TaxID=522772 RepID=D4H131_DENA2|nr:acetyl-CoA carboxylase biotin carboxyl carrier protein subunit [Denitrovibrio acetiphilus]ADD68694.1 biotin/lipoyl attachment domain-containing protein [Denitrovibrio acetiphilus DSM 12809]
MITKRNYFATIDGGEKEYIVELVENTQNQFTIDIDGRKHSIDFAMAGDDVYSIIIDGKSYAMEIDEKGDIFDILMENGDNFSIEVLDEMKRLMKMRHSAGLEGRQIIEAQMPGYIWKILVEKGQEVKAGEPLMILVAMKMENEIKAPKDGIVEDIFVELDQTIVTGDRLAVVE